MPARRDPGCRCARPPNEHRVWSAERAEFLKRHAFERVEERNDQRQADYRCGRCGRLWTEQGEDVGFGSAHRFYKHLAPSEIARDRPVGHAETLARPGVLDALLGNLRALPDFTGRLTAAMPAGSSA